MGYYVTYNIEASFKRENEPAMLAAINLATSQWQQLNGFYQKFECHDRAIVQRQQVV